MATIIDKSEHIALNVDALDSVTIQHDKNTPDGTHQVRVSVKDLSLGLGATILVRHDAELILNGVVAANVLGTIDIGNGGKVFLNSTVGVGVLNDIHFNNTRGKAVLLINTSKVDLTGAITGFGPHDTILLGQVGAVSGVWTQGLLGTGTLALYDAGGTEVSSIGLVGTYKTADFSVNDVLSSRGTYTTNVSFVPPSDPASAVSAAQPVWNAAESFGGSMPGMAVTAHAGDYLTAGALHR